MEARKYKVKDLLTALLVSNINSAAIALAEKSSWKRGKIHPPYANKTKNGD